MMDWKKNKWLRTVRRFATVFILSGMGVLGVEQTCIGWKHLVICFLIGGLAGLDKYIRDENKTE